MADGWNMSALARLRQSVEDSAEKMRKKAKKKASKKITVAEAWNNGIDFNYGKFVFDEYGYMWQQLAQKWEEDKKPATVEEEIKPEQLGKWGVHLDG